MALGKFLYFSEPQSPSHLVLGQCSLPFSFVKIKCNDVIQVPPSYHHLEEGDGVTVVTNFLVLSDDA